MCKVLTSWSNDKAHIYWHVQLIRDQNGLNATGSAVWATLKLPVLTGLQSIWLSKHVMPSYSENICEALLLKSQCYNKQNSDKQADMCADSHHVISPSGGGYVVPLFQIKTDVCVFVGHPYCCWYVCVFLSSSTSVCGLYFLFIDSLSWKKSLVCAVVVFTLLSLSVMHHKSDHHMPTNWTDLKMCNP